ncbi:cyclophilin-type peptidylprolyl cis-trans isomerase [Thecamonas trahens ATCC 50062]|uniref:Cyclophilin-type peptidylprolyl cis-trans isomerase n=1 Tax=Thecamonas trahens ATCC 50062 TaxID=461836 RepID=A0A0L0DCA8_THETB|nr:cyclophilin-type peptidylprolyl cis-trans isomerase [Thecamonas trahens ATCC 50062]KNC49972.1 cyclophilin-type peptidylprolyl cis-trans isomerase [Thecamonas trahens ATCC 50062]|eukprot:XP_013757142.1 cyclophilin-type peptidylprolyl cis-trans isomerase [Thecamonas trahens ATCC 50062]
MAMQTMVCLVVALALVVGISGAPSPRGPDRFVVSMRMSTGAALVVAERARAPLAADRMYALAKGGVFDDSRFFRVIRNDTAGTAFVAQWGTPGNPEVTARWLADELPNEVDGSVAYSNTRGTIAFGAEYSEDRSSTCCRSIEMYINYADNSRLDALGFTAFAVVQPPVASQAQLDALLADGPDTTRTTLDMAMAPFEALYAGYGENFDWDAMYASGNAYLDAERPLMSHLLSFEVVAESSAPGSGGKTTTMAPAERTASTLTLVAFALLYSQEA